MNHQNLKLTFLIIGHLINALYYLSFPHEAKAANQDLFSLWFFGSEFLFIALICSIERNESNREIYNIFLGHLYLKATVYILHYSHIAETNSRERLNFFLGYIFLLSLKHIQEPIRKLIWRHVNR